MSHCPRKCHICQAELWGEQKFFCKSVKVIRTCRMGPTPTFSEDEPEFGSDSEILDLELALDLDTLNLRLEMIHARQTMSQRLAEAHQKHLPTEVEVPKYIQGFVDVFSNESFDVLPNWKL